MLMPDRRHDICLVCMPDCPVTMPPLGLALLHTLLSDAGFAVKTLYPNLWFSDQVGTDSFKLIRRADTQDLAIEWVFSGAAFREKAPLRDAYIDKIIARNPRMGRREKAAIFASFHSLRREAEAFVEVAARRILAHRPRIVGCTSTFQQHVASLAVLRRIRELAPDVITLMGGSNCESVMGRATHRAFEWVDYVVSGEADALIVPLCRALLAKGRDVPADELPYAVFGPAHRDAGYPVASGGDGVPRASLASMEGAAIPNYDDYFEQFAATSFDARFRPALAYESARGCWFGERSHCTFCGLNGSSMTFRSKDPALVVQELETLHRRYGTPNFYAVDNIIDMRYFETMLPALAQRRLPLRVWCEAKANLKRKHVTLLNRAGYRWLQPGIESLNTNVLKLMAKGLTAAQNVLLLKHAGQAGVRVFWQSILGFPGELDEWYAESAAIIPLITHLQPGGVVELRYQRYSAYHTRVKQYGLDLQPCEMYAEVYPLAAAALTDLAFFFESPDAGEAARILATQPTPQNAGRLAYRRAHLEWQYIWETKPPVLQAEDIDGVLRIEDTRAVAPARQVTIGGLDRDLLRILDEEMFTRAQLAARLHEETGTQAAAVEEAIDRLVQRKLLIELDGKLVSLVLSAPVTPLAPNWFRQLELAPPARAAEAEPIG